MNRALALLTGGALLTMVLGVLGSGDPVPTLLLGAVFAVLGTAGFWWARRRGQLGWAVAFAIFSIDPGVGATLLLVVLVSQCVLLLPLPGTALVIALSRSCTWGWRPGATCGARGSAPSRRCCSAPS